jgi:hypothetical protein
MILIKDNKKETEGVFILILIFKLDKNLYFRLYLNCCLVVGLLIFWPIWVATHYWRTIAYGVLHLILYTHPFFFYTKQFEKITHIKKIYYKWFFSFNTLNLDINDKYFYAVVFKNVYQYIIFPVWVNKNIVELSGKKWLFVAN